MATEKRKGLPEFWVTGLAKILVGEQPCELEPWLKAHFRPLDKITREDNGSLAKWKADHTEQLRLATAKFTAEGWKCSKEQYVRLTGQTAVIAGKIDLLTQRPSESTSRPVIRDAKSGRPQDSDTMQVLIYQVILPLAWKSPHMQFDGQVMYGDGSVVNTSAAEAQAIRGQLFNLVKRLGTQQTPPEPSPSESACRFCEITDADCKMRFGLGTGVDILTSEF